MLAFKIQSLTRIQNFSPSTVAGLAQPIHTFLLDSTCGLEKDALSLSCVLCTIFHKAACLDYLKLPHKILYRLPVTITVLSLLLVTSLIPALQLSEPPLFPLFTLHGTLAFYPLNSFPHHQSCFCLRTCTHPSSSQV